MASNNFTVIYDSNVLFPMILRDLLMRMALTGLFKARWTQDIHDEWIRAVMTKEGHRPNVTEEGLRRCSKQMDQAVLDALIEGHDIVSVNVDLPDKDDMHIVQAAVHGRADVIVTFNEKDFPREQLQVLNIEVQHPDEFVANLLDLSPMKVCHAAGTQRQSYHNPKLDKDDFFRRLEKVSMAKTVERLRQFQDVI